MLTRNLASMMRKQAPAVGDNDSGEDSSSLSQNSKSQQRTRKGRAYSTLTPPILSPNSLKSTSKYNIPLTHLPRELIGEILTFCALADISSIQSTCHLLMEYIQSLLPILRRSFDWTVEFGKLGSLEYLIRMSVPIESISLDTSSLAQHDVRWKVPHGDPLLFLNNYRLLGPSFPSSKTKATTVLTATTTNSSDLPTRMLFQNLRTMIIRGVYNNFDNGLMAISHFEFPKLHTLILSYLPTLAASTVQRLLAAAPMLHHLSLERSFNAATDATLQVLSHSCPHIRTLSLAYCSLITDSGLVNWLRPFQPTFPDPNSPLIYAETNNENIDTSNTRHAPPPASSSSSSASTSKKKLHLLHSLQEVSFAHCYELTSAGIAQVIRHMPQLTVLSLEWCFQLSDELIHSIANTSNRLSVLGVEHCEGISDGALAYLLRRKPTLAFLSADSCTKVAMCTAEALALYSTTSIQDLYLNSCNRLTDTDVVNIATHCPQLRSLGIEDCGLSDVSVTAVAEHCSQLTVLGLNNNIAVTDQGLTVLLRHLAGTIERLYLSNTQITNRSIQHIADQCRTLFSLSVIQCTHISYAGLKHLGDRRNWCYYTLQDVHLSDCLRDKRFFYREYGSNNFNLSAMPSSNDMDTSGGSSDTSAQSNSSSNKKTRRNIPSHEAVDVQFVIFGITLAQLQQNKGCRARHHGNYDHNKIASHMNLTKEGLTSVSSSNTNSNSNSNSNNKGPSPSRTTPATATTKTHLATDTPPTTQCIIYFR